MTKWEIAKAVRASDLPAASRLIMFVLADMAHAGTAEIPPQHTPSLSVLAKETGLHEATVKRRLNELEVDGWVIRSRPTVDNARMRGERTRYQLAVPESPDQGAQEAHVGAQEAQTRAHEEPSPGRTVRPNKEEPDLNQINQISSSPQAAKRGSRIPDDFPVTDDMKTWARQNAPHAGTRDHEAFVDYWRAQPGQRGVKLDWVATWRNWMRRAEERHIPNGHRPAAQLPPSSAPVPLTADEQCAEHRGQRKGRCRYCAADAKAGGAW